MTTARRDFGSSKRILKMQSPSLNLRFDDVHGAMEGAGARFGSTGRVASQEVNHEQVCIVPCSQVLRLLTKMTLLVGGRKNWWIQYRTSPLHCIGDA